MIELFRYIEQSFVQPASKDNSVNLESDSAFQNKIRIERNQPSAGEKIRKLAQEFIAANFAESPVGNFAMGENLLEFHHDVLNLKSPTSSNIDQLVERIFDKPAKEFVQSEGFEQDKQLLSDSIIAVKLITAFDKVDAPKLVSMRQAIEFLMQLAEGKLKCVTQEEIKKALLRPMYIPSSLFPPKAAAKMLDKQPDHDKEDEQNRIEELKKQAGELKATYEALMAINSDGLEVVSLRVETAASRIESQAAPETSENLKAQIPAISASPVLLLTKSVLSRLDDAVVKTIERADIDVRTTSLPTMVATVKEKWINISKELEPYLVPAPLDVYRLGIHTFAVQPLPKMPIAELPLPDFSHAITRPVGIGRLQVVRQELVGYEPGEISHIENVLEGELYRRTTRRAESSEVTITTETEAIQTEERDLQSTERNEMATEAQKEAGKQTVATQGQTTSTDYGKLVENSKTNYARSVTDRAVNRLTQKVRNQRTQRERRSYMEKTEHQFDNSTGETNVRGIYQWVDKKYKTRIMNYGERLLYDVVVPEPAAFLIESLKNAQRPEAFQLVKPIHPWFLLRPWFLPQHLDTTNYMGLATLYGVTGSVEPPPDEFITTISEVKTDKVEKIGQAKFYTTKMKIQPGYQAVGGYVTRLTQNAFSEEGLPDKEKNTDGPEFEFYVGQYRVLFGSNPPPKPELIYIDFSEAPLLMNKEEGEVPVLFRSFSPVAEFGFAIGICCKRKDKALEVWQLKTYAALVEGYRRQLAEYEDKLAQQQTTVRIQMSLANSFARNPSVETTELKRMFIHLLVSEHLVEVGYPPPISNQFFFFTDPNYVKKWGAVVAFFERAFEWENMMYVYYPYFYGRLARWGELILIQDLDPQFEEFLKAGAARLVVPVRPGFEAAMAHYHETGDVWMGEEMPSISSDLYVSIIDEIKARNFSPGEEVCVAEWDVKLPTTLVMLRDDKTLPEWKSEVKCGEGEE